MSENPVIPGPLERGRDMFALYREGKTMQQIADKYGITRERVRQLIEKSLIKEMAAKSSANLSDLSTLKNLKSRVHKIVKRQRKDRVGSGIDRALNSKYKLGVRPENFFSTTKFSKLLGVSLDKLERYRPDVIETILNNKRKRWSRFYAQCRYCGTTVIKHHRQGLCLHCSSGGDREAALSKFDQKCAKCGIKRDDHRAKYSRDLYIAHINGNRTDTSLENLLPLCRQCFTVRNFKLREWNPKWVEEKIACSICGSAIIDHHGHGICLKCFSDVRSKVFKRSNKCFKCGRSRAESKKKYGRDMAVIHINRDPKDFKPENLVPLCGYCFSLWRTKRLKLQRGIFDQS